MESLPELETIQPYFIQDEEKDHTYNRTGVIVEVENDNDEIFYTVTSWVMLGYIGISLIGKLF